MLYISLEDFPPLFSSYLGVNLEQLSQKQQGETLQFRGTASLQPAHEGAPLGKNGTVH